MAHRLIRRRYQFVPAGNRWIPRSPRRQRL